MILDVHGESKQEIAEYFCRRISNENVQKIRFSFDGVKSVPRILLKGDTAEVFQLVNALFRCNPSARVLGD